MHIKIKHNGGTKTEREKLAYMLVEAYSLLLRQPGSQAENIEIDQETVDKVDLNLPPGILTKTAQKSGLLTSDQLTKFNEVALLTNINLRLAPKFREMICQQSIEARRMESPT